MKRKDYRPGAPLDVSSRREGARHTLVFVRELAHPPERVWAALTDPAQLREWAPFDADHSLTQLGDAKLTMINGSERIEMPAVVLRAEAPKLLEYRWDKDVLRWELEPTSNGTRLTLLHVADDPSWLPKLAAGWHLCLDVAEQWLAGSPIGRIVGSEAKNFGWEQLNDVYAEKLGIPSTGGPDGTPGAG